MGTRFWNCLLVFVILLGLIQRPSVFDPAAAQADSSQEIGIRSIGNITVPSFETLDVAVLDHFVYTAEDEGGLRVFDVSDPTNPQVVFHYPALDCCRKLVIEEKNLFVADRSGLFIFNVSSPAVPCLIGQCSIPFDCEASYIQLFRGHYLFLANCDAICIVDIEDPREPKVISSRFVGSGDGGIYSCVVIGSYAYLGFDSILSYRLSVVNLTDLTNPIMYTQHYDGGCDYVVTIGEQLFASRDDEENGSELTVYNVSTSGELERVTGIPLPDFRTRLANWESCLFLSIWDSATRQNHVEVLDVSDLDQLQVVGNFTSEFFFNRIATSGQLIYVACVRDGLRVVEMDENYVGHEVSHVDVEQYSFYALTICDDLCVASTWQGNLEFYDINIPGQPVWVSRISSGGYVLKLIWMEKLLLVVTQHEITVLDCSDPTSVNEIGSIEFEETLIDAALDGDHLFLTAASNELWIVSLENPVDPVRTANVSLPARSVSRIAVEDNLVFVKLDGSPTLQMLFAADVTNPVLMGNWSFPPDPVGNYCGGGSGLVYHDGVLLWSYGQCLAQLTSTTTHVVPFDWFPMRLKRTGNRALVLTHHPANRIGNNFPTFVKVHVFEMIGGGELRFACSTSTIRAIDSPVFGFDLSACGDLVAVALEHKGVAFFELFNVDSQEDTGQLTGNQASVNGSSDRIDFDATCSFVTVFLIIRVSCWRRSKR